MFFRLGLVFLLAGGQASAFRKADYKHSKQIAPALKIHWKEVSGDEIFLALETKNIGWAAFGIADPASGSMPGSDIVVAELGDTITLKDRYAMGKYTPLEDACNDWVLVAGETQAGTTYVEMKRKLVTNDPQDRPFNLGTPDDHNANMAVIFAWGSGNVMSFHQSNRIATRINFKQPDRPDPFIPVEADDKIQSFEVRSAWRVKSKVTDYYDVFKGNRHPVSESSSTSLCPEGYDVLGDQLYIDEKTGTHKCKDVMAYCSGDSLPCGDLNELAEHFLDKGCCAEGSPICRVGSVLVPDHTYQVRDAQSGKMVTTNCKASETYCSQSPHLCGSNRNALGDYFAGIGCCKLPGSDQGKNKRCAGGSTRQCEEVLANGLTFQCSMIGTQTADSIDVLLLHGFPEYNKFWDPLLDHWEATMSNIHAVACNLRGYSPGASPSNVESYEWEKLEADVWAIADAVNFNSFHIVSHDLGAALAWRVSSREQHKDRVLSLTTLSVYHPDLLSKAILESEEQMVASNYFNQFAEIDSAQHLSGVIPFDQRLFWWYNTSIGNFISRPQVPSDDVFKKYPQFQTVTIVRAKRPIGARPAVPATSSTGTIYAPTFMVCGGNDPYLLCNSTLAKESSQKVESGKEYKYGSFACGHDLFKGCISQTVAKSVMTSITNWLASKHPQRSRLNNTEAAFACNDLRTDEVKQVCVAAQSLGLDKIPLTDGVKDLDRTLTVELSSPNRMQLKADIVCSPNNCNTYELPPVTSFQFEASTAETDTAHTRGDPNGSPVVHFDCDAAEDMYTLLFWDAVGFLGGPSTRTSKGFLHGTWTNIPCNAQKKANFTIAVTLVPYVAPANPSVEFANNYGFYLFKQKSKVTLTTDGKVSGFDVSAFTAKGQNLDIADVLAPLRPFLQDGGPKARVWANAKTSPYSAYALASVAPDNALGQCGGEGLGGTVEAVKAAWAKFKTADAECSTTCGCEVQGVKFCNHEKQGPSCEACSGYNEAVECNYGGLPEDGAKSCIKNCFPAQTTGCRVFDQWLASKGGDYSTALAQVTSDEKFVLCEAYHTDSTCENAVKSVGEQAAWDSMCKDLKGKSGQEILLDIEAHPEKEYHIIGFKHIVTPGLEKHIHHMTVEGRKRGEDRYKEFMWVWALGMDGFLFPEECGVKLGGDGIVSIKINMHYDNPAPQTNIGKLDMSGIKVFYTDKLRQHDCGTFALGDPGLILTARLTASIPKGYTSSVFTCPGECTKKFFPNGATIFGSFLHQHQNGQRIWTSHSREGNVIHTELNDFWDHNFQTTQLVNGTVLPGDIFTTTCINYAPDDSLVWGLASDQEMCINYIYYWPKVYDQNYCGYRRCGSMDPITVLTDSKPTSFGSASSTCAATDPKTSTTAAATDPKMSTTAAATGDVTLPGPGAQVNAGMTGYESLFATGFAVVWMLM